MTATPTKLPELPEPARTLYEIAVGPLEVVVNYYTADQMHAYALAYAATLAPGCEWQPIETAPHGENILIAWEGGQVEHMKRIGSPASLRQLGATHWMPLPAPPATGETK